jgi:hypothetical protein
MIVAQTKAELLAALQELIPQKRKSVGLRSTEGID